MAQLTPEEQEALDKLIAKQQAPEETGSNGARNVEVYIDLSDETAVKRALDFGLLKASDITDDDDDDKGGDKGKGKGKGDGDEDAPSPRRRGYFKDDEQ